MSTDSNKQYKVTTERVCTAVRLECAAEGMDEACRTLKALGFRIASVSINCIVLQDVSVSSIPQLSEAMGLHSLRAAGFYGEKEIVRRERVVEKKPLRLALSAGGWYFCPMTEQTHPFVQVSEVRSGHTEAGDPVQVFELNFFDQGGSLPESMTLVAPELVKLKLRPATTEDYERLNMIPPSDLSQPVRDYSDLSGHGIPDPTKVMDNNSVITQTNPASIEMRHWQ